MIRHAAFPVSEHQDINPVIFWFTIYLGGVCSCSTGYDLICEKQCVWNNCFIANGGCDHNCQPDGLCFNYHILLFNDFKAGTCTCNTGYDLQPDGKSCLVNNCFNNNGGCDHKCHPDGMFGVFQMWPKLTIITDGICSCDRGYDLVYEKKCVINYCYNFNGGCAHNCQPDGMNSISIFSHFKPDFLFRCRMLVQRGIRSSARP